MIVLDTHVLVLAMDNEANLGPEARRIIDDAPWGELGISAITPWELALLVEKRRLRMARPIIDWLDLAFTALSARLLPIVPGIAVDSVRLPGTLQADPADRLIVATARHWGAPVMTADTAIIAYGAAGHVGVMDATR